MVNVAPNTDDSWTLDADPKLTDVDGTTDRRCVLLTGSNTIGTVDQHGSPDHDGSTSVLAVFALLVVVNAGKSHHSLLVNDKFSVVVTQPTLCLFEPLGCKIMESVHSRKMQDSNLRAL